MGPIRGLKRRKKAEQEDDHNGCAASLHSQTQSLDWWDDFSKRLTDNG